MNSPCELLKQQIQELFLCKEEEERIRVRTPFLYPDGDVIDLYVVSKTENWISVTDYGETVRWLKSQTLARKKSPKQKQMISDICTTLGVELFRGMLIIRVDSVAKLTDAIFRLGQCSVRVADIWLTMRTRLAESFADEVADLLDENKIRYERGEKLAGRSGLGHVIDFHIRQPKKSTLLNGLSTGSKAFARGTAERTVAAWLDLDHLKISTGMQFVTLFDDSVDVWTEEEFKLVARLSDIERWSDTDALLRKIA